MVAGFLHNMFVNKKVFSLLFVVSSAK